MRRVGNPLTTGGNYLIPVWSPNGNRIVHWHFGDLYITSSDGTGAPEPLLATDHSDEPSDWSPDGQYILFTRYESQMPSVEDIWVLPMEGDGKPFPLLESSAAERRPRFSPDGKWISYTSNESGRNEVYVKPFPGPGPAIRVSADGGEEAAWMRDGGELFFRDPSRKLMAAKINLGESTLSVGEIEPLFPTRMVIWDSSYDVTADGQRFVMVEEGRPITQPVTIVVNWSAQLTP